MSTLNDVLNFVKSKLSNGISNVDSLANIDSFLDLLFHSSTNNCKKLLICIGIDLKTLSSRFNETSNEYKEYCNELIRIINLCVKEPLTLRSTSDVPPSTNFGFHIKENYLYFTPFINADRFENSARILPLRGLLNYVIKKNLDQNPDIIPEGLPSIGEKIDQIIGQIIDGTINLGKLNLTNLTSGTGWVFFTDKEEIQNEIDEKKLPIIIDRLGWYMDNIDFDEYVVLEYPDDFSEKMFKPCTLNGDWGGEKNMDVYPGNGFFITHYNVDTWGRTCSVSGYCSEVRERIHTNNNFLKVYQFKVDLLGKLSSHIYCCVDETILENALNRFHNAN